MLGDLRESTGAALSVSAVRATPGSEPCRLRQISITMEVYAEVPDEVTRAALKRLGDQFGHRQLKPGN